MRGLLLPQVYYKSRSLLCIGKKNSMSFYVIYNSNHELFDIHLHNTRVCSDRIALDTNTCDQDFINTYVLANAPDGITILGTESLHCLYTSST